MALQSTGGARSTATNTSPRKLIGASEAAIQAAVIAHWRLFRWEGTKVAAIPNANAFGQAGLSPGLFDLLVITPRLPVGFIELKRESLRSRGLAALSKSQREFYALLMERKIPAAVCFGRDEPIDVLEEWGAVRRGRRAEWTYPP
jgi:hypothetical protein